MADEEIGKLIIKIEAQIEGLKSELKTAIEETKKFDDKTRNILSQTERTWKNLPKNLITGFLGAGTAIGVLHGALSKLTKIGSAATEEWKEQQKADEQLATALGYTSDALKKQATELQNLTIYSEEETQNAMALLGAWTKDENLIKRLIPVIQDFASAKRLDLLSATDMVTKSIFSETNALSRLGFKISETNDVNVKASEVIKQLNGAYSNMALAIGATDYGTLERLKNIQADISTQLGKELVPLQIKWNKLLLFASKTINNALGFKPLNRTSDTIRAEITVVEKQMNKPSGVMGNYLAVDLANKQSELQKELTQALIDEAENAAKKKKAIDDKERQDKEAAVIAKSLLYQKHLLKVKEAGSNEELMFKAHVEMMKGYLDELTAAYDSGAITASEYYELQRDTAERNTAQEIAIIENKIKQINDSNNKLRKITDETLIPERDDKIAENNNRIMENKNQIILKRIDLKNKLEGIDREELKTNKEIANAQKDLDQILLEYNKIASQKPPKSNTGLTEKEKRIQDLLDFEEENKTSLAQIEKDWKDVQEKITKTSASELDKRKALEKVDADHKKLVATTEQKQQEEGAARKAENEKVDFEERKENFRKWSEMLGNIANLFDSLYQKKLQTVIGLQKAITNAQTRGDAVEAARLKNQLTKAKSTARALFYMNKGVAIAEASINGALAILKAYRELGIYGGIAMAALVGAQIGIIVGETIAGPEFHAGGSVEGPSGTDTVNAKLTRKEFVQPVPIVKYYGLHVMEAMRRRAIPRELFAEIPYMRPYTPFRAAFSMGGAVSTVGNDAGKKGSPTTTVPIQINNVVDQNLFSQYLASSLGKNAIFNLISNNSTTVKRMLEI